MSAPTIEGSPRQGAEAERDSRPGWYWPVVIASVVAAMLAIGILVQGKVGDLVESAFDFDESRPVSLEIRYDAHGSGSDAPIVELEPAKLNEDFDVVPPLAPGDSASVELKVAPWSGWQNSYGSGLRVHLSDLPLGWIYDSFECTSPVEARPIQDNTFQLGYYLAAVDDDLIQSECIVSTRAVEPAVLTIRASTTNGHAVPVPVTVLLDPSTSRELLDPFEIEPGQSLVIRVNPTRITISPGAMNGWLQTSTQCGNAEDTYRISVVPTEGQLIECTIFYEAAE